LYEAWRLGLELFDQGLDCDAGLAMHVLAKAAKFFDSGSNNKIDAALDAVKGL
jgi:hypothetical protein